MAGQSLSERVYENLYRRVLERELLPGDIVDRRRLAAALGVSVSPVVQAIARLEIEGIVEILPRKVTRVRIVRPEDFRVQVLIRAALEAHAARHYCGRPVRDHEARLMRLAEQQDAISSSSEIDWRAEIAFHRELVGLMDSPGFLREYDRMIRAGYFILVSRVEGFVIPRVTEGLLHVDLIKALRVGDPDLAGRIMREHVEYRKEEFIDAYARSRGGAEDSLKNNF